MKSFEINSNSEENNLPTESNSILIQENKSFNHVDEEKSKNEKLVPLMNEFVAYKFFVMKKSRINSLINQFLPKSAETSLKRRKNLHFDGLPSKKIKILTTNSEPELIPLLPIIEEKAKIVEIQEEIKISPAKISCKTVDKISEEEEPTDVKPVFESIKAIVIKQRRYQDDRANFKLYKDENVIDEGTIKGVKISKKNTVSDQISNDLSQSLSDAGKKYMMFEKIEELEPILSYEELNRLIKVSSDFLERFESHLEAKLKKFEEDFVPDEIINNLKSFVTDFRQEKQNQRIEEIILSCRDNFLDKIEYFLNLKLKLRPYNYFYLLTVIAFTNDSDRGLYKKIVCMCLEKTDNTLLQDFIHSTLRKCKRDN